MLYNDGKAELRGYKQNFNVVDGRLVPDGMPTLKAVLDARGIEYIDKTIEAPAHLLQQSKDNHNPSPDF